MQPITNQLFDLLGDRVRSGPFQGMRINPDVKWDDGNQTTKLLGSYEFELHHTIEKAICRNPDTVINIGCAEGYYAVGLGKLLPESRIYAVDVDGDSLRQCEQNAYNNNLSIDHLSLVLGRPSHYGLQLLANGKKHLLFVDIEGDEIYLLDKTQCPLLINSDIIVECHDFLNEDEPISAQLIDRFSDSHDIDVITQGVPYLGDYQCLSGLPIGRVLICVTEKRPTPTVWLACWTRSKGE
jgi:Methylase of polypeptide chain release factors